MSGSTNVSFGLSKRFTAKTAFVAAMLAPALLGGCNSRDAQMSEQIAAANAAAMRAEQAAQRAEHAAANAQRSQPATMVEDADPNEDPNAQAQQQPKTAEAHPDANTQTIEG
ncbi:MAG: hypothetical protein ACKOOL_07065 [Novosphingobium sp.]